MNAGVAKRFLDDEVVEEEGVEDVNDALREVKVGVAVVEIS